MRTYPIKFEPILKEKIWGGAKLKNQLNKNAVHENVGESWEISGVEQNISIIKNGLYKGMGLQDALSKYKEELLGEENFNNFGTNFPLLIKFLDAKTNLSVQVHPDDSMAKERHNSFGKTEMWYIMDSDPNAEIVIGLKAANTDSSILNSVNANNVDAIFNKEKVTKGDSFFIPAGKVHAIGAGVLAAEIQQTSDLTYRVYDWDRKDDQGKTRELHTGLAIKATKHFPETSKNDYVLKPNGTCNLVECPYFTTNILDVKSEKTKNYQDLDSFVILMCVEGSGTIAVDNYKESIRIGETILVPAKSKDVTFHASNAKFLEVYILPQASKIQQAA